MNDKVYGRWSANRIKLFLRSDEKGGPVAVFPDPGKAEKWAEDRKLELVWCSTLKQKIRLPIK